ncbi:isochorismatase family protein [Pokkaliibacter sp. MBI-7]|uniref:isochorismatase family protein n=1 Tax=Pokkaliibacter sp. MBI-7 TaxID=3040600 RepID=UPI00244B551C|nr:isochorismatase family protein [Pokkaliibacter sp. MBI-7]MDH2434672.1 isochorismatase family protein [Pokkaliibacter sp. MBI-7]
MNPSGNTALVIIDMQVSLMDEHPWQPQPVIATINRLIHQARDAGAPVCFVWDERVEPDAGILPELNQQPSDWMQDKHFRDAFMETALHARLQQAGIHRLVMTGMQTDYCVDTSCRAAAALGYEVILVSDGHTTPDSEQLTGEQIVRHHNRILNFHRAGQGSIAVLPAAEIVF